jgi:alpha-D-xyloside xylohydrolase
MVKLRDGMWLPAEGVRTEYAEEVYETEHLPDQQGLSLLCPTKRILRRGDTLNQPTVTLVSFAFFPLST